MATNPVDHFWGTGDQHSGSVPPVEPADLRSVWTMQSEIQARNPGQQIGISTDAYKRACGPEAADRATGNLRAGADPAGVRRRARSGHPGK